MKIPLFPLDLVLFPGAPLPLHIFEPRFREMVAECLATNTLFGVVRAERDGLAVIGCSAQIVRVLHSYPDGRSDILTQGMDRFEIDQIDDSRSFLQADVTVLPDMGEPSIRAAREECVAMHFEILSLLGIAENSLHLSLDAPVAYLLAAAVPGDLDFQQALLAMRSDRARTETLLAYYRELLPKLRRNKHAARQASTNGHIM
ncbi:MAG TPA: LON peptidase substrate-binding domain-containing protein [Acidobacteriaceae bacterium]